MAGLGENGQDAPRELNGGLGGTRVFREISLIPSRLLKAFHSRMRVGAHILAVDVMPRGEGRGGGHGTGRGGRGRGRGRGRGQGHRKLDRDAPDFSVSLSKRMSHLLRHGAVDAGLGNVMDAACFVPLSDVLTLPKFEGITKSDVRTLVANCPKGRFELKVFTFVNAAAGNTSVGEGMVDTTGTPIATTSGANTQDVLKIRATQGHTMRHDVLDDDTMLTRVDEEMAEQIKQAAHGTTHSAFLKIKKQGISAMRRRHVHMARSTGAVGTVGARIVLPSSADGVNGDANSDETSSEKQNEKQVSGFRYDSTVAVWVDVKRGVKEGVPFFVSKNGVVLSPGEGESGVVPPRLFLRAECLKTEEVLEL